MLPFLRALSLTLVLAAVESACARKHVAAPVVPSTPAPAAAEPAPPPTPAAPVTATPSPPVSTLPARAPQPQPPSPAAPPQAAQPPAPHLGDILTSDQQKQYNSAIDQSLARTQTSLGSIAKHRLTREQQAVVTQIQNFVQQAQSTRKSNLPAARSLADRADVLARDLAGSLR
jgi:hypothetical protein